VHLSSCIPTCRLRRSRKTPGVCSPEVTHIVAAVASPPRGSMTGRRPGGVKLELHDLGDLHYESGTVKGPSRTQTGWGSAGADRRAPPSSSRSVRGPTGSRSMDGCKRGAMAAASGTPRRGTHRVWGPSEARGARAGSADGLCASPEARGSGAGLAAARTLRRVQGVGVGSQPAPPPGSASWGELASRRSRWRWRLSRPKRLALDARPSGFGRDPRIELSLRGRPGRMRPHWNLDVNGETRQAHAPA